MAKAKTLMIQGTMSNAGKSLLVTGLLRIYRRRGYKTAPFKSQNMALNSYITPDGLEIGRAQAVQAEAAGAALSADMNPILLKPSSDTGSQVIVRGVPVGNMPAREYFKYKKQLFPTVRESLEKLRSEFDIVIIEGAGSPAEINLREDDIVNMGIARMAGAPVLLAGDIDRGGVFAQLYGTAALLPPEERKYIKGLIINKFRGDKSLLDPGLAMLENACGIPVVGVVPMLPVDIDDEDSLSERLSHREAMQKAAADIAVIRYPHLSNFTDFHVLERIPGCLVRYVSGPRELGEPDLIILPGTKNTVKSLLWLKETGLETLILKCAERDTPIFGICGGFQILGETLDDREGTEGGIPEKTYRGLGLLPVRTRFTEKKRTLQTSGRLGQFTGIFAGLSGLNASGYEVHMGETQILRGEHSPAYYSEDGAPDGISLGNICGTYVHGIFDEGDIARRLAAILAEKKGMTLTADEPFDYREYREKQYDLLADGLLRALDMDAVDRILREGIGE